MKLKRNSLFNLILTLVMLLSLLGSATPAFSQSGDVKVIVDPQVATITTCDVYNINIRVENVEDLTGYHLEILFDPEVIEVIEVENGDFLAPPGEAALFEPSNEIDNENGIILFGMVQQGEGTGDPIPKSGDGVLISIVLKALVPDVTTPIEIDADNSLLVDWPDAFTIDFTTIDGVVNTERCPGPNLVITDNTIEENKAIGTRIGTFITLGPNLEPITDDLTYELVSAEGDDNNNSFTIDGSDLLSNEIFNYENKSIYRIRVRSTGQDELTIEKIFYILVLDVNDPPIAFDQTVETDEGQAFAIVLTGDDEDGDEISFELVSDPENGTLTGELPNLVYTPDPGFTGEDYFDFKVIDALGAESNVARVTIIVNPSAITNIYFPLFLYQGGD